MNTIPKMKDVWQEIQEVRIQESDNWNDFIEKQQELKEKRNILEAKLSALISIGE
jgi:hypothetical protein